MLLETIRTATRQEHCDLEETLLPYIERIKTKEDYGLLLNAFYGYFLPVQQNIHRHIDIARVPDIAERRSADLLENDLRAMRLAPDPVRCADLPAINSHHQAMGALYVMEGSTLGGKIIKKMIAEKLGSSTSLEFFNGYGDKTGYMWKKFLDTLGRQEADDNGIIVESVRETFSLFDKWLKEKLHTNDG